MIEPQLLSPSPWVGLRIGLLGGSFNPAHRGHLELSLYALRALRLDAVWWMVSWRHPVKPADDFLPFEERLAQARRLAMHPRIVACRLERSINASYTIDVLKALRDRFRRSYLVWLMGTDNLAQFDSWHRWREIFAQVPIAVIRRQFAGIPDGIEIRNRKSAQSFCHHQLAYSQRHLLARSRPPAWMLCRNRCYNHSSSSIRSQEQGDQFAGIRKCTVPGRDDPR